jgi:hypothetical protein
MSEGLHPLSPKHRAFLSLVALYQRDRASAFFNFLPAAESQILKTPDTHGWSDRWQADLKTSGEEDETRICLVYSADQLD